MELSFFFDLSKSIFFESDVTYASSLSKSKEIKYLPIAITPSLSKTSRSGVSIKSSKIELFSPEVLKFCPKVPSIFVNT